MWTLFAFASAFFAGLTAILAKCGVRRTDSTVATAIRTAIVLAFSWEMVFLTGAQSGLRTVGGRTLLFLILSCHRSLLAVLLPGFAAGGRQQGYPR